MDYVCPDHGDDGILDVVYDCERVSAATVRATLGFGSMWTYRTMLPVGNEAMAPPLRIGGTPLYSSPRLADLAGLSEVWIKDEGVHPTGSLKDRASAMAIVKAAEHDAEIIITASTGNAAAALAGVAASVGQRTVIFLGDGVAVAPSGKWPDGFAESGAEVLRSALTLGERGE